MAHEASGRWVDQKGRSHNFSISSDVADRGHIESLVRSIYPAKTVHINYVGPDREKQKRERDAHIANERAKREQQSQLNQGGSNNFSSVSSVSFVSSNRSYDYDEHNEPMTEEEEKDYNDGILIWIGIIGGFWALFTFTPWILMLGGGVLGTLVGEKVTGQSIEEYTDSTEDSGHTKAAIALALALLCGGFGFIQGNNLQNDWNNTDQIEEVRS